MIAEIEAGAFDRRIDHGKRLYSHFAQDLVDLRLGCEVAPAERTMQSTEQADQQRPVPAKIIDCDLSLARNGVEHDVGRPVAGL